MVIFEFLRAVIGVVILLWSGVMYVCIYLPAYLKWIKENSVENLTNICQSMWQYNELPLCLFEASLKSSINYSNCRIWQDVQSNVGQTLLLGNICPAINRLGMIKVNRLGMIKINRLGMIEINKLGIIKINRLGMIEINRLGMIEIH